MLRTLAHAVFAIVLMATMIGAVAAGAQDGTPPPAPAITADLYLETETGDGQVLTLLRATFDPGAGVTSHHHPGTSIFFVESGAITFGVEEGTAMVTRAAEGETAAEPEEITAGSEVVLSAGDSITYGGDAMVTDFNFGSEPATVIVTNVREAGESFTVPVEATPAS